MNRSKRWQVLGFAVATALSSPAFAEGEQCSMYRDLPVERQLRRLAIDLKGTVPDLTEYDAVAGKTSLPAEIIDAYVASDEFRLQMRRYHEGLLWTNPALVLGDVGFALSTSTVNGNVLHFVSSTGKRRLYRGGDGTHICQAKPQSVLGYDAQGMPNVESQGMDGTGEWFAEGYVEVHPYWESDPAKTIKVCAFDAQASETYTLPASDADAGTHSCDTMLAIGKTKFCGCGPNLNYCMLTSVVQTRVLADLREQVLRFVDEFSTGARPYSNILKAKTIHYNGPLVHYFKYLAQRQTLGRTQNAHAPADGTLPDLKYTDTDTWMAVEREAPHAGVLTLPAFLLRFQTNRGRANRYRIAFLGEYFQPPSTKDVNCNPDGDDLTQRCVCRNCHVALEPIAAYFGQFAEAGSMSVRDFAQSYATAAECAQMIAPRSSSYCDRFYSIVPDLQDPDIRRYRLKALQYADAKHPSIQPHFDEGPAALAQADIMSGAFHEVAIEHLFEFLMKRPPNLDPTSADYEGETLAEVAKEFQATDDFRLAVRRLVELPLYRRTP
jgi:hypothetical protein